MQTFRFVVVYRPEKTSASGKAEVWRGWIEQVFPDSNAEPQRLFFQDPGEVGDMIKKAVGRKNAE